MTRPLGWLRAHALLALTLAGFLAFYLWTAKTSGPPFGFGEDQPDFYNLLADGFLSGTLGLDVPVDPRLLALEDPYDPAANGEFRLHDATLYEGRYYIQWGPVPVLLLFLPFRLLPFGDLPQTLAACTFAFAGLCFAVATFRVLVRRFLPGTPRWLVGLGVIVLGTGSAVPFALRRVQTYEVSLLGAYAFAMAGLYAIATALLQDQPSKRRLALGSLAFGLAAGCRPTMIVPAFGLVVLTWWLARRPGAGGVRSWAPSVLGPAVVCGVGLALYNVLRFGSPAEFGTTYQLSGVRADAVPRAQLDFLPPGLDAYLLQRAPTSLDFPFFFLPPSPDYPGEPPQFYASEPVAGLLTNVPIVGAGVLALIVLAVRRRAAGAARAGLAVLGVGAAIVLFLAFTLYGTTQRYELDFASWFLLAGLLGFLGAWHVLRPGWPRRALGVLGAAAVAWGAAYGVAISFTGYYDGLRTGDPEAYETLQDLTSPLPTIAARLKGEPQLLGYSAPDGGQDDDPGADVDNVRFVVGERPAQLRFAAGSPGRWRLRMDVVARDPAAQGKPLTISTPDVGRRQQLRVRSGTEVVDLPLTRGINRVDFATAGPLVDVSSLRLERPDEPGD